MDFEGNALTFAHVGFGGARVSGYGVDVAVLDARAEALLAPRPEAGVYLIDEIGKMECLLPRFAAMRHLLASDRCIVATVAKKGEGLIDEVKRWPGSVLWEVSHANRDRLPDEILAWLDQAGFPER